MECPYQDGGGGEGGGIDKDSMALIGRLIKKQQDKFLSFAVQSCRSGIPEDKGETENREQVYKVRYCKEKKWAGQVLFVGCIHPHPHINSLSLLYRTGQPLRGPACLNRLLEADKRRCRSADWPITNFHRVNGYLQLDSRLDGEALESGVEWCGVVLRRRIHPGFIAIPIFRTAIATSRSILLLLIH